MNSGITSSKQALECVKDNGLALKDVPARHKTDDVCMAAVKNCGRALEFVPKKDRSLDVCLEAFAQDAEAYQWVPGKYSGGTKMEIVRVDFYGMEVPAARRPMIDEKATKKFTLEAVRRNPVRLLDVPEETLTPEALKIAAQADSGIYAAASGDFGTGVLAGDNPGIAVAAAAKNPNLLNALPPDMLTKAFLEAVDVERNGSPEEKAAHWRRLAVKGGEKGLALVPPDEAGPGLRIAAFLAEKLKRRLPQEMTSRPESHAEALQNMPDRLKTPELESFFSRNMYRSRSGWCSRLHRFCLAAGLDPKDPQTAEALKSNPVYRKLDLEERAAGKLMESHPMAQHAEILQKAREMDEEEKAALKTEEAGSERKELKWTADRQAFNLCMESLEESARAAVTASDAPKTEEVVRAAAAMRG